MRILNIKSSDTLNRIQTNYQKLSRKIKVETTAISQVSDKSSAYFPQQSFERR